jgi:molybdate-binding protein
MLLGDVRRMHPDFYDFQQIRGIHEGLGALNGGYTNIALTHLLDVQTGDYNIPYLEKYLPDINQTRNRYVGSKTKYLQV